MNISKNNKGFTVVELLLAIIAVALIIFVGFYVVNNHKDTPKSAATSQPGKKGTTVTDNTVDVSTLNAAEATKRQLHVTATFDGVLKTVTPDLSGATDDSVSFEDPAFTALVKACQSSTGQFDKPVVIATVQRVPGTYSATSPNQNMFAVFQQQFSNFYLEYTNPDGGYCDGTDTAKNQAVTTLFGQLNSALQAAIKSAKE
jgi:VCBS repeat-containing protein